VPSGVNHSGFEKTWSVLTRLERISGAAHESMKTRDTKRNERHVNRGELYISFFPDAILARSVRATCLTRVRGGRRKKIGFYFPPPPLLPGRFLHATRPISYQTEDKSFAVAVVQQTVNAYYVQRTMKWLTATEVWPM